MSKSGSSKKNLGSVLNPKKGAVHQHGQAAGPAGGAGDAGPVKVQWIKIIDNGGPRVLFQAKSTAITLYGHFPFAGNKSWVDLLTKGMDEDHVIYYTISENETYKLQYTYSDLIKPYPFTIDIDPFQEANYHWLVTMVKWTPI